jgi:hypothetical protein
MIINTFSIGVYASGKRSDPSEVKIIYKNSLQLGLSSVGLKNDVDPVVAYQIGVCGKWVSTAGSLKQGPPPRPQH